MSNQIKTSVKLDSIKEPQAAKDGRLFYGATFSDPLNPFGKSVTRNFWQQFNIDAEGNKVPVWKGADPKMVKPFVGKTLPGYIVNAQVEPYEIAIPGQEARTASTYTTVILNGESEMSVFKGLGHPLLASANPVVEEAVVEEGAVIE